MVEQYPFKVLVLGSSPSQPTSAELDDEPEYHLGGRVLITYRT